MAFAVQHVRDLQKLFNTDNAELPHSLNKTFTTFNIAQEVQLFADEHASNEHNVENTDDNEPSDNTFNNQINDTDGDYEFSGVLNTDLTSLTQTQRSILMVIVLLLFALSLFGNFCTLYVNAKRKVRPFFRACLISLACGDIMNTIFLTVAYVSQFTTEYVQIWRLGKLMCSLVPFATTTAILASSMTLVGIALDRYFAVMKAVMGCWNPDIIFCTICMFIIWVTALGISSPVFWIYTTLPVYILAEDDDDEQDTDNDGIFNSQPNVSLEVKDEDDVSYILVREQQLVHMCVSETKDVTLYYAIVFVIIFIPSIVAFIWLNSVIARKLWTRRHRADRKQQQTKPKRQTFIARYLKKPDEEQQIAIETMQELHATNNESNQQTRASDTDTQTPPTATDEPMTSHECTCDKLQTTTTTLAGSFLLALGNGIGAVPIKVKTKKILQHFRHQPQCKARMQEPAVSISTPSPTNSTKVTSTSFATASANVINAQKSREARHIRMFIIIIIMMAAFIFLRLPAWVFLIMRMYGSYSRQVDWVIYFSFGILNLTSCCLNPLFYTFLTQTIQYFLRVKEEFMNCFCCCLQKSETPATECGEQAKQLPKAKKVHQTIFEKCGMCCFCCNREVLETTQLACYQAKEQQAENANVLDEKQMKLKQKTISSLNNINEKDEGVECSEDGDSLNDDYDERIYTIFPATLVSSSINSE